MKAKEQKSMKAIDLCNSPSVDRVTVITLAPSPSHVGGKIMNLSTVHYTVQYTLDMTCKV